MEVAADKVDEAPVESSSAIKPSAPTTTTTTEAKSATPANSKKGGGKKKGSGKSAEVSGGKKQMSLMSFMSPGSNNNLVKDDVVIVKPGVTVQNNSTEDQVIASSGNTSANKNLLQPCLSFSKDSVTLDFVNVAASGKIKIGDDTDPGVLAVGRPLAPSKTYSEDMASTYELNEQFKKLITMNEGLLETVRKSRRRLMLKDLEEAIYKPNQTFNRLLTMYHALLFFVHPRWKAKRIPPRIETQALLVEHFSRLSDKDKELQAVDFRIVASAFAALEFPDIPPHLHVAALTSLVNSVTATPAFHDIVEGLVEHMDQLRKDRASNNKRVGELRVEVKVVEEEILSHNRAMETLERDGAAALAAIAEAEQQAVGGDDARSHRSRAAAIEIEKLKKEAEREWKGQLQKVIKERNRKITKLESMRRELKELETAEEGILGELDAERDRMRTSCFRVLGWDREGSMYLWVDVRKREPAGVPDSISSVVAAANSSSVDGAVTNGVVGDQVKAANNANKHTIFGVIVEPFADPFKNIKNDEAPKVVPGDAASSAAPVEVVEGALEVSKTALETPSQSELAVNAESNPSMLIETGANKPKDATAGANPLNVPTAQVDAMVVDSVVSSGELATATVDDSAVNKDAVAAVEPALSKESASASKNELVEVKAPSESDKLDSAAKTDDAMMVDSVIVVSASSSSPKDAADTLAVVPAGESAQSKPLDADPVPSSNASDDKTSDIATIAKTYRYIDSMGMLSRTVKSLNGRGHRERELILAFREQMMIHGLTIPHPTAIHVKKAWERLGTAECEKAVDASLECFGEWLRWRGTPLPRLGSVVEKKVDGEMEVEVEIGKEKEGNNGGKKVEVEFGEYEKFMLDGTRKALVELAEAVRTAGGDVSGVPKAAELRKVQSQEEVVKKAIEVVAVVYGEREGQVVKRKFALCKCWSGVCFMLSWVTGNVKKGEMGRPKPAGSDLGVVVSDGHALMDDDFGTDEVVGGVGGVEDHSMAIPDNDVDVATRSSSPATVVGGGVMETRRTAKKMKLSAANEDAPTVASSVGETDAATRDSLSARDHRAMQRSGEWLEKTRSSGGGGSSRSGGGRPGSSSNNSQSGGGHGRTTRYSLKRSKAASDDEEEDEKSGSIRGRRKASISKRSDGGRASGASRRVIVEDEDTTGDNASEEDDDDDDDDEDGEEESESSESGSDDGVYKP
ncbi:hypothetical protein HDU76_001803 [Blyttiomyces sp. JEL0837]|nr:hypothetical protein HDU76_001803 [Blyttiomyces sp. JEL0837]